jgi:DNA-binding XRE family transcriptional regulator
MKVQIIENAGQPEWAVIPYAEYERMLEQLEELADIRTFDNAKRELAAGVDEVVPAALVERLANGENPLRVWREYRGLTQQALAEAAGIGKSYISQLEAGTKTGALGTLRALAAALNIDLDDLEPWTDSTEDV